MQGSDIRHTTLQCSDNVAGGGASAYDE